MSRTRSRDVPVATSLMRVAMSNMPAGTGDFSCIIGNNSQYAPGLSFGYVERSTITDDFCSGPQKNWCPKNVDHVKQRASLFSIDYEQHTRNDIPENQGGHWRRCMHLACGVLPNVVPSVEPSGTEWGPLVVDLANQVRGLLKSSSQIWVTLAEVHKTYEMVRNPFQLLKGGWRSIAGSETAFSLSKRGANLWLEGKYGWSPLLYDTKNFVSSCHKYSEALNHTPSAQGSERCSQTAARSASPPAPTTSDSAWAAALATAASHPGNAFGPMPNLRIVFDSKRFNYRVGCFASTTLNAPVSGFRRALSAFGGDSSQLLSTIWELVPFSFVVDWFVNTKGIFSIPDFAAAAQTLNGVGASGLCYSSKGECLFQGQGISLSPSWISQYTYGNQGYEWLRPRTFSGTTGGVSAYHRYSGIPPLSLRLFQSMGLSVSQLTSLSSLFIQRVGR